MSTLSMTPIAPGCQKSRPLPISPKRGAAEAISGVNTGNLTKVSTPPRPILAASNAKRRVGYSSYVVPVSSAPSTVLRRNARERNRVKQVNHGFAALRNHVPSAAKNKKISKVETLRRAVEYIQALQAILDESNANSPVAVESSASLISPTCSNHRSPISSRTDLMPNISENNMISTESTNATVQQTSPLTMTPHSVSSVDSGFVDVSPTCYMSPRDASPVVGDAAFQYFHSPAPNHNLFTPQHLSHTQPSAIGCVNESTYSLQNQSIAKSLSQPLVSPPYTSSEAASPTPSYSSVDTPNANATCNQMDGPVFSEDDYDHLYPQDEELLDAIAWWQSNQ